MTHDAIVVGAGLSGLVCARRLAEAGRDVLVLEARDRVGGRLWSGTVAGAVVDLGGAWLSVGQPRLAALAAELGVSTYPHRRDGRVLLDEDPAGLVGRLAAAVAQWRAMRRIARTARASANALDVRAARNARSARSDARSVRTDARSVRDAATALDDSAALDARSVRDAPTALDDDDALDARSVRAWLDATIRHPVARERIAMHAELVFASDLADLSLLHYLTTLDATGGFGPRGPDLPGGGREHAFTGGAQSLALRLAEQLGDRVRLGEPVRAIEVAADTVTVRSDAARHTARHVVVAIPPVLARDIDMPLSAAARRLAAASFAGAVVKCFAAYDGAFWRDDGWSGEAYRPWGTVRATVELAPSTLLAFVVGPPARAWRDRDPADRRAELLDSLAEQFGPAARSPVDYLEVDWSADPWSAGCVACVPPGVLGSGASWTSHGRIHLAGTETARQWPGYMEGAIEAGERAASEVLEVI